MFKSSGTVLCQGTSCASVLHHSIYSRAFNEMLFFNGKSLLSDYQTGRKFVKSVFRYVCIEWRHICTSSEFPIDSLCVKVVIRSFLFMGDNR